MILVTVGTNEAPFDRLLVAVGPLAALDEVVVQHGSSHVRPPGARCVDFLPFEELVELVRAADVVVTHAGVGSVMTALANGKRPFVVPRLRRHGEAVDDHQATFALAVADAGLVEVVADPVALAGAISVVGRSEPVHLGAARRLIDELRGFVAECAGPPKQSGS